MKYKLYFIGIVLVCATVVSVSVWEAIDKFIPRGYKQGGFEIRVMDGCEYYRDGNPWANHDGPWQHKVNCTNVIHKTTIIENK